MRLPHRLVVGDERLRRRANRGPSPAAAACAEALGQAAQERPTAYAASTTSSSGLGPTSAFGGRSSPISSLRSPPRAAGDRRRSGPAPPPPARRVAPTAVSEDNPAHVVRACSPRRSATCSGTSRPRSTSPAGGSAAAIAVAMGAGLTAMCARNSRDEWPEARGATAQAETLRARIEPRPGGCRRVRERAGRVPPPRAPQRAEVRNATLGVALERAAAIRSRSRRWGPTWPISRRISPRGNPGYAETPSPARFWPRRACRRAPRARQPGRGRTTSGSSGPMRTPRPPRDPCGLARSAAAMSSRPLPAWSRSAGADELRLPVEWPAELTRDWAWGDSTGKDVRVCILDSGIEPSHPRVERARPGRRGHGHGGRRGRDLRGYGGQPVRSRNGVCRNRPLARTGREAHERAGARRGLHW